MQQVQRRSLVDTVVDEMKREIATGNWQVGDRIPSEAELTAQLGVSRPSVREAVRSLVQLGLLETRQGDGTYVVATDATQVALRRALHTADRREVILVRKALDALAAGAAAEQRSDADLEFLAAQLRARSAAIRDGDVATFTDADVAFHLGVARISGNRLLSDIYASFDHSLRESITDASCLARGDDPDRADQHETLYQAIAAGDPEAARNAALGVLDQQERLLDASE
ncbi:FadR/GntR family transcriptional regulator [Leucobacter denitrificans]|uniref:FadR family transcriptional regulator n=1 Tax=Leucobacter denitrificans TaxID=683042 RepID=A0A7G9S2D0_9MICO|nr:FadR/GntR family transcriptional regulator [Leucobacter denitrificans]QNN62005.1 FadR family transcriptional regulator [Leucobacter denitrificans]